MAQLENDFLRIIINPKGAELNSIFNKKRNQEYLWNGDPKFWPKQSPTLFPIVGELKDNRYFYNNKSYEMGRHGFTRLKIFTVIEQLPASISFTLLSDEGTLKVYPFQFSFSIIYTLMENSLSVTFRVKNTGAGKMYFSVGGHPAFKLPVVDELAYDDYFLLFNKTENAGHYPIGADGLIATSPLPLLENTNKLTLSKPLFYKSAIVLKNLQSDEVQLKSDKHPAGLSFSFKGFPYLGIWAAKDANFVCIEPWCGLGDNAATNQQLIDKEGINILPAGDDFKKTWSVTIW